MERPFSILGTTFDCECGKTHTVATRELIYSEKAIQKLPDILARCCQAQPRRIALVADQRTYAAAGKACGESLVQNGWTVQTVIIPDSPHGDPVCDDKTRDAAVSMIKPCDFFLAVGGGVINDLVKWISSGSTIPYAVFATAASMNGYASSNIAPSIGGIKRVISGTVPLAIMAVPSIIEDAPFELTASGLGDVLAKPVSMTDWKLNQILFNDYYCPFCAQLIHDLEPGYMMHPKDILLKKPSAIEALFRALVFSGVSMTMANTSFPASGGEHMISHALDMTASMLNIPHDYHGRQVGLGTIFACALYERVLDLEKPCFHLETEPTDTAYWQTLTPVVEEEHALKRHKAERAVDRLNHPGVWDEIRAVLKPGTRKAAEIKKCLSAAGAAHRIEHIGCSRERFLNAALHCHQMRERYTIIDLARAAGVLPLSAEEIIDEYL